MTIAAALLLALALGQESTRDADRPSTIDADRPHVGTGTHVVDPGEVQFEVGVQWQGWTDIRTFGSPALVRVGVSDRLELRMSSDGFLERSQPVIDVYGIGNAQLGAKIRLLGGRDEPYFSVMPTVGFGLASREKGLGAGATDATVVWLAGHPVGERLHVEGNYGIGAIGDTDSHFAQHLITGAVILQATRKMQTYVEAAWWSRQERSGSSVGFFDYGVIAAVRPRLLIDVGAFSGFTLAAPDWGFFSGVSFAIGGRSFNEELGRGARANRQRPIFRAQHD
jgi:outer membrane putative beta-barrel porin/alpha-amylase